MLPVTNNENEIKFSDFNAYEKYLSWGNKNKFQSIMLQTKLCFYSLHRKYCLTRSLSYEEGTKSTAAKLFGKKY